MNDLLKVLLPTVANVLLPGVGAAATVGLSWLAGKLGVPEDKVKDTILGMSPEQLVRMKELDNELAIHLSDNGIKLNLAQIEVNKEEAKVAQGTTSWLVQLWIGGWRPYIGWIGGTGIGYQFLARPLLNGLYLWVNSVEGVVKAGALGPFPSLEIQDLIALVMTLLGSAVMRSVDKRGGISNGQ